MGGISIMRLGNKNVQGYVQKFLDWPPRARTAKWYSSLPLDAVVSLFCESV
jgi:hypothetical protein